MQERENDRNEEISLVDLIAVALRWRRLIWAPTLIALVAALIMGGLRLGGVLGGRDGEALEASLNLAPSSGLATFLGREQVEALALRILNDPVPLEAAIAAAGIAELGGVDLAALDRPRRLFVIRELLLRQRSLSGKAIAEKDRLYKVEASRGVVRILLRHPDAPEALAFLSALAAELDRGVRAAVQPLARAQVESYERVYKKPVKSEPEDEFLAKGYMAYLAALRYEGSGEPSVATLYEPYVLEPQEDPEAAGREALRRGAIMVIGALFLGIFLAFVVHYAYSLRKDPLAMSKLREALRG